MRKLEWGCGPVSVRRSSAEKCDTNHVEPAQNSIDDRPQIEWFAEYEIVMASAEPKPMPYLAPSMRTP